MRMRTHDGPLRRIAPNLAFDAGAKATGRIVVFVHGLCETDLCWWFGAARHWDDPRVTFGSKLRDDDGWTPLYVNYNSGLHISDNGRELSEQLETLVETWPVPVDEIALVGHSMGGLIARSAAHQADESHQSWVRSLTHIVGLGAPHLGAPLERLVSRGTYAMSRLPETKPFADWLNRRSVGIKDLRYGAILEADWQGFDPDTCLDDRCTDATLLPGVLYSVASATLSTNPEGFWAQDLLVQHASAHGIGPTRSIPFDPERSLHLGGKNHFDLLGDPLVYAKLREWLSTRAAAPAATA
jgi:pimeloyl-ACP methyl ester carboxylesterase